MVRYPLLALSFTQAHLCDTPFCNVSRDNSAIPHKNLRLQESTVGGSLWPKLANFCKNWQFLLFIGSGFLLEIQFLAIFGQYSFQQYCFGSLKPARSSFAILSLQVSRDMKIRKIRAPIKIKSALPPPPPLKRRNFTDTGFPAERTLFFQVSVKLAQPFPAPELRTRILRALKGFF